MLKLFKILLNFLLIFKLTHTWGNNKGSTNPPCPNTILDMMLYRNQKDAEINDLIQKIKLPSDEYQRTQNLAKLLDLLESSRGYRLTDDFYNEIENFKLHNPDHATLAGFIMLKGPPSRTSENKALTRLIYGLDTDLNSEYLPKVIKYFEDKNMLQTIDRMDRYNWYGDNSDADNFYFYRLDSITDRMVPSINDFVSSFHRKETFLVDRREIVADYDDEGVYVYAAFKDSTGEKAVENQTFVRGSGFKRTRMTWIKPSLGWILHRSRFATKEDQTTLLRIKVTHEGFNKMLKNSVLAQYEENAFHSDTDKWRSALKSSDVRVQWDPARDYSTLELDYKAIQIGIKGEMLNNYLDKWIISIEDYTDVAKSLQENAGSLEIINDVKAPIEKVYEVPSEVRDRLNF